VPSSRFDLPPHHSRAQKLGVDPDSPSTASHSHPTDEEKHLHHQIGGLKAALHNDKVRAPGGKLAGKLWA
jgi:hypothetical protein